MSLSLAEGSFSFFCSKPLGCFSQVSIWVFLSVLVMLRSDTKLKLQVVGFEALSVSEVIGLDSSVGE